MMYAKEDNVRHGVLSTEGIPVLLSVLSGVASSSQTSLGYRQNTL